MSIAVLAGSVGGAFLAYEAQSVQPLTTFLSPLFEGMTVPGSVGLLLFGSLFIGSIVYVTIPILVGATAGLIDRKTPWVSGLLSGLLSGSVNLVISLYRWAQLSDYLAGVAAPSVFSKFRGQFIFFAFMLTLLWCILAAFSAKLTAWSLEEHRV